MIITRPIIITLTLVLCTVFTNRAESGAFLPHPICNDVVTDTLKTESFFPINSARISESQALRDFVLRLDSLRSCFPTVVVRGSSSPDGPEELNLALSLKRALAIKDYIAGNTSLPDSTISVIAAGEDWAGFRNGVGRIFSPADASEITAIIDSSRSNDERELRLRAMDRGRIWRRLKSDLFPSLRGVHINAILSRATARHQAPDSCVSVATTPLPCPAQGCEATETSGQTPALPAEPAPPAPDRRELPASPSWYLKTNLPAWAMLWTNIAVEFDIHPRLSVQLPVYYSGFNYFTGKVKFRTLAIQPEARYWFGHGYTRKAFVGMHFGLGWYNVAFGGDTRYQDHNRRTPAIGGGIAGGYRFRFTSNPRWQMEASVGVGCYRLDYDHFENRHNGHITGRTRRTFFGLDQVALSVSYSFGLTGKGGDR